MESLMVTGFVFVLVGVVLGCLSKKDRDMIIGAMYICTGTLLASVVVIAKAVMTGC